MFIVKYLKVIGRKMAHKTEQRKVAAEKTTEITREAMHEGLYQLKEYLKLAYGTCSVISLEAAQLLPGSKAIILLLASK